MAAQLMKIEKRLSSSIKSHIISMISNEEYQKLMKMNENILSDLDKKVNDLKKLLS